MASTVATRMGDAHVRVGGRNRIDPHCGGIKPVKARTVVARVGVVLLHVWESVVQHAWCARRVDVGHLARDGADGDLEEVEVVRVQPVPARGEERSYILGGCCS